MNVNFERQLLYFISGDRTTEQVQSVGYTGLSGSLSSLTFQYTYYNTLGAIATINSPQGQQEFTYDNMGQLTEATLNGEAMNYIYAYDGAGSAPITPGFGKCRKAFCCTR